MTTESIAKRLVEHCRKADWSAAQKELYAEDARSIEPFPTPDFPQETIGLKAILEKGEKFNATVEKLYRLTVSDALVAGNSIAIVMDMDVKMKGRERMSGPELCLYQVKDGKIISEQFFV